MHHTQLYITTLDICRYAAVANDMRHFHRVRRDCNRGLVFQVTPLDLVGEKKSRRMEERQLDQSESTSQIQLEPATSTAREDQSAGDREAEGLHLSRCT